MKSLNACCILLLILYSCEQTPSNRIYKPASNIQTETRPDFKTYYDKYELQGSFILFNQKENKYTYYNEEQLQQAFTPASTFKICNTLIGLETKVIEDENFVIEWDKVVRTQEAWNKTQDLKSAFKNSTVWYYQELARRVGGAKMKSWLDKIDYGNKDTTGGIDQFWLDGGLRITPKQQINFLVRLKNNELPVSKRSVDILKKIMLVSDTNNVKLYAKTGWGFQKDLDIGWYVGFVEHKGNTYYFANCVQSENPEHPDFREARKAIALAILKEMKIME